MILTIIKNGLRIFLANAVLFLAGLGVFYIFEKPLLVCIVAGLEMCAGWWIAALFSTGLNMKQGAISAILLLLLTACLAIQSQLIEVLPRATTAFMLIVAFLCYVLFNKGIKALFTFKTEKKAQKTEEKT